jgi:hypothetical protein
MSEPAATLTPADRPRLHRWDEDTIQRIAASDSDNGCSQTHRTCLHCGLIRITMHPPQGFPWPEFMLPESRVRFRMDRTPHCVPKGDVEDIR